MIDGHSKYAALATIASNQIDFRSGNFRGLHPQHRCEKNAARTSASREVGSSALNDRTLA